MVETGARLYWQKHSEFTCEFQTPAVVAVSVKDVIQRAFGSFLCLIFVDLKKSVELTMPRLKLGM
jgi:hypothetical protein